MKICSFLFFLLLHFHFAAQENLVDKLHPLQQNPTLKEKVYIHTNKTSYFTEDTIWFKAYVGDTINFPSIETTKLYVNLLDGQGTTIYSKNILINDGTGSGEFELNDAVIPGRYYLQAYTNFMRNFGDAYHYLQQVMVVGENPVRSTTTDAFNYDIQLFPEGGHLLEGIQNTIGIRALVNGKGIEFSGNITKGKGDTITTFKNQHLGMAKCQFIYEIGKTYTAYISINDTLLKIKVPKALEKGLSIQVDNTDKTYLEVAIKTNETTFYNQIYSNYTLLYHQDRQIFGLISINKMDSLTGSIKTNKDIFLDGVNTVTLFEDDRPIAARQFFIENEHKLTDITIEEVGIENDSLNYKMLLQNRNRPLKGEISLSVLQANSEAKEEKQNIRTAFLLTPFLRGHIENPAYYFDPYNKNRNEHLDLLLLTQGWSRYALPEMITELNPEQKFEFEYGFELKGKLKSMGKYNTLALIADDYKIIDKVRLDNKLEFVFKDLLLFKGDTAKVAYLNWLGKVIKPEGVSYDTIPKKNFPIARIPFEEEFSMDNKTINTDQTTPLIMSAPNSYSSDIRNDSIAITTPAGTIALDEVILTERKRSERYLQRRKIIEKYKPIVPDIGRYYDIPVPEVFKNYDHDLLSYLKAKEGIRLNDSNSMDVFLERMDKSEVLLFIDGRLILPEELPSAISISMKDIANVMVLNRGRLNGELFFIPIYQVFTTDTYRNNTIALFDEHMITNGYDKGIEYYSPIHDMNTIGNKSEMEIDWKPSLKTNKNGEVFFKVLKQRKPEGLLFSIQGFSEEGHLISETIKHE